MASLFGLKDWRGVAVTKYNATTKQMSAEVDNGINLYDFYEIQSVKVDKSKIMFNNGGNWVAITANKNANLDIVDSTDATRGVVTVNGTVVTIDATSVANINKVEFIYTSASQGVTSQYDLKIPVTLVYSWGELQAEMPATVKVTMGQE